MTTRLYAYLLTFALVSVCLVAGIFEILRRVTQPNSHLLDMFAVTDAIYDRLSKTQIQSLDKVRFSASKLRWPGHGANITDYFDTIVIGSGVGGCAAASLHAQAGKKVLLLEQNERFGGCTHSFTMGSKDTECEFDTGLHYVQADMVYDSCRAGATINMVTRGNLKFIDLGSPYDIVTLREDNSYPKNSGCENTTEFRFPCGEDELVESVLNNVNSSLVARCLLEPRIREWLRIVKDGAFTMPTVFVIRLFPRWLQEWVLFRIPKYQRMLKYGSMTTKDVQWAVLGLGWTLEDILSKKLPVAPEWSEVQKQNGELLQPSEVQFLWPSVMRICAVLTHPIGDYACQPRDSAILAHALTANYYLNGAAYTVGHTQGLSSSVLRSVLGAGGQAFCRAMVEEIIIKDNRAVGVKVRPKDQPGAEQTTILCNPDGGQIICATSIYNLYHKFLRQDLLQVVEFHKSFTAVPSYGHTYLFVRLGRNVQTTAINTWYFGDFDLDKSFDEYFEDPTTMGPPTVYIGFPSMKDVTWQQRFPGCKSALLIADAKWDWFKQWEGTISGKRGQEYEEFKEKLSKQLLEVLYQKVPGTRDNVEAYWLGTPLSDHFYVGSFQGGSYGTRCNVDYFTEHNLQYLMTSRTKFKGLHLAGSDAFCPSVAGAQNGGLMCGLNSLPFSEKLSIARRAFEIQTAAIRKITQSSVLKSWLVAGLANLNIIPTIKPAQKKLRPIPPACSDDPNDPGLFLAN